MTKILKAIINTLSRLVTWLERPKKKPKSSTPRKRRVVLKPSQRNAVRQLYSVGRDPKLIREEFDISESCFWNIVEGIKPTNPGQTPKNLVAYKGK